MESTKNTVLCATIPYSVDINANKLIIHFKDNDYSFARSFEYKRVYVAKQVKKKNSETFEPHCYKLTFNNPHDSEKSCSWYVSLTWFQNLVFCWYRFVRWFKDINNILWVANILVLMLNIVVTVCRCRK